MEIRSTTFFCDPTDLPKNLAAAVSAARTAYPHRLQTVRLATPPFPNWLPAISRLNEVVGICRRTGIDYLSLGPVQLDHSSDYIDWIPDIIAGQDIVFASAEIANSEGQIDIGRIRQVAAVIRRLSRLRPDGFANLYFTAAANCPAGSPFFPVAYHDDGPAGFAIATEAADLAVRAFQAAGSLQEARVNLVSAIEGEAMALTEVAEEFSTEYDLEFGGIDFSLAPFPEAVRSLGKALEALGAPAAGSHGSLFAAAFLAECVDRARFPRCGFSGLMFPVLEDATLARRAAEGTLTIESLLLYSAVCGAGLDTLPLPGEVDPEVLAAILLDLAALAARLDKPLTARLMPLPGLEAGDPVSFDFSYFADSRVMEVKEGVLTSLLSRPERIAIRSRARRH